MTSVRFATPEASSSSPGALAVLQLLPAVESWWAPSTTTSDGKVVPGIVRTMDGWAVFACTKYSTLTSGREAARACHRERIQAADWSPVGQVWRRVKNSPRLMIV